MLAIWCLVPPPFLNPAWTSGSSWFTQCWSLGCLILSMTLLAWEMNAIVWWLAHSLVLPFLVIGMRIDLFQSCGLQICWHNECKSLMASSFIDLQSSARISSHPLAFLTAVLLGQQSKVNLLTSSRQRPGHGRLRGNMGSEDWPTCPGCCLPLSGSFPVPLWYVWQTHFLSHSLSHLLSHAESDYLSHALFL